MQVGGGGGMTCTATPYAGYAEAAFALHLMTRCRSYRPDPGERAQAYRCKHCPAWHVGTSPRLAPPGGPARRARRVRAALLARRRA